MNAAARVDAVPATRWWHWAAIAGYFAANALLHLQFSLWLTAPRLLPWGGRSMQDLMPAVVLGGAVLLAIVVLWQLQRSQRPMRLAAAWLLWLAAVVAIDRWLTFSLNEAFHYPQYALLAWLIARALDPQHRRHVAGRVLFWTAFAGSVDELLQYLWVTADYSHYFDFNDVLVNLVAAMAGLLLHIGAAPAAPAREPRSRPVAEIAVAAGVALAIVAALALGRLQLTPAQDLPPGGLHRDTAGRRVMFLERTRGQYGSWLFSERRGRYYALPPRTGLPLVAAAALLFTLLATAATPRRP